MSAPRQEYTDWSSSPTTVTCWCSSPSSLTSMYWAWLVSWYSSTRTWRNASPVVRQPVGEEPQHVDRAHDQVVEVHGVQLVEPSSGTGGRPGRHLQVAAGGGARCAGLLQSPARCGEVVDVDEAVLGIGDPGVDAAGREALDVVAQILQAVLDQPDLVVAGRRW